MSKRSASNQSPKVVADPIYGIIDIRPVLGMVETREFQALGDKRQLGMSYLTFPSATHTRKVHSLGSYHATRELANQWIKRGFINSKEGDALAGYALYHDIGHPAFSHVTEDLCEIPGNMKNMSVNSALSLVTIERLKKEIASCGINFNLLHDIARHKNPLFQAVSDKNLGMEKLDYLERDGLYTILSRPTGIGYLRQHIYFINNSLAIDEKAVDNAIETQNYYLKIYKNVYLRKSSVISQRMMQKMVYHLIRDGELTRGDLSDFTDSELIGSLRFSKNDFVKNTYELLRARDLFREAIVIRPKSFAYAENRPEKATTVIGAENRDIKKLTANPRFSPKNQNELEAFENEIADIAGLPWGSVLITPVTSMERFEGKDIMIYQGPGRKLASLKARYPAHFKNIEEVAQTYLAFRICTTQKYRKILSSPKVAKKVFDRVVGR